MSLAREALAQRLALTANCLEGSSRIALSPKLRGPRPRTTRQSTTRRARQDSQERAALEEVADALQAGPRQELLVLRARRDRQHFHQDAGFGASLGDATAQIVAGSRAAAEVNEPHRLAAPRSRGAQNHLALRFRPTRGPPEPPPAGSPGCRSGCWARLWGSPRGAPRSRRRRTRPRLRSPPSGGNARSAHVQRAAA